MYLAISLLLGVALGVSLCRMWRFYKQAEHWKKEACLHLQRSRDWEAQAKAFEQAGHKKDKLLALASQHIRELREQTERETIDERELHNLMVYDGTGKGQLDLHE